MITASIVTYHTDLAELSTAISCLRKDGVDRIYVIDNASETAIEEALSGQADVEYIPSANVGYGAGHNQGIRRALEAGTHYHLVMNSDVYWSLPVIPELASYMDSHPDVGQMMPKVLNTDGTVQLQCKLVPTPADLLLKRFMPSAIKRRRMRRFQLEYTGYDKVMNVPYLSGCFMFFRAEALRKTGMFDERFFMYPEDIDITRRMHEQWLTLYYPSVCITHIYAVASRKNLRLMLVHAANMVRYFNKWGWIFDRKRRFFNSRLLRDTGYKS